MSKPKPTLETTFCGIPCLNPFWLASAPPTNCGEQVMRAFDAGWGGAVWKTIGAPITNVSSRYSSIDWEGRRMMGFNNIELISDRPTEVNLEEIAEVKRRYPKHVVIASLMVESKRETWHDMVQRAEDAGADGLELNFGCPHGMSERGMGSAVGQVPEYCEQITAWVKEKARTPVIVKLTPNISDIRIPARAAKRGGADALSAINTINSITSIDLDTFQPSPSVDGKSSHGGYCGPAVKPIALNMVQQIQADPASALPLSGIGGIGGWRDAAEFILLGCGTVQVCTAAMHYGYRIVEDMQDGLASSATRRAGMEHINAFTWIERRPRQTRQEPLQWSRQKRRGAFRRLLYLNSTQEEWAAALRSLRLNVSRASMKSIVSAAISVPWFVRWRTASRWSASTMGCRSRAGKSVLPRGWFHQEPKK